MIGNASIDAATTAVTLGAALFAALCLGLGLGLVAASALRRRRAPAVRPVPAAPRRSAEEAPRYQTRRDELLATLGHELRSPLRALLGLLDTSTDERVPEALRRELHALAAHALRIAEDSLDFALLERGAVRLLPVRIDLEAELGALLAVVRPLRPVDVRLELDIAPGLAPVREGDGARLKQILVNLVANALAHTEHGCVRVSVGALEHDADVLRFEVRDSGTGMTPAERQRAFQPFAQGDAPRGRAGIGLAVVARIVEAMAGTVSLTSEPGLGSNFVVELPMPALEPPPDGAAVLAGRLVGVCCAAPADLRAAAAHLQHWNCEVLRFPDPRRLAAHLADQRPLDALVLARDELPQAVETLIATRAERGLVLARSAEEDAPERLPGALLAALTRRADAPVAAALAGLEVLVVDDHPVVRRVLRKVLSELGCRVTCAEDGGSAAEIASDAEEHFDWVLLDRRMPGLDGLATAALLREAPATRAARIALLVNDAADDPGSAELFDRVLVRPQQPLALRSLLTLTLSDGRRREKRRFALTADEELAVLRDDTLREDLAGLRTAHDRGDGEAVTEHLHRMEGALRLCPDPGHRRALDALCRCLDADAEVGAAVDAFLDRLAFATRERP